MMFTPFLDIKVDQVVPKRKEVIDSVIGDSFTTALPFHDLPLIKDKNADVINFEILSILPGRILNSSGKLELIEEGVKTRAVLSMNLKGLLLRLYLMHWVPVFFLWLFQGVWISLVNEEALRLVQDWVFVLLMIWPLFVFVLLRRRIKLRMLAYVNNLKFH